MVSDVPLGGFLSGGYDSSCVVAFMQKNSMNKIKTFSIGFEQETFNEAQHAKEISKIIGTDHNELYLSKNDLLETITSLPKIYSEPFADSSQIPTHFVSIAAKKEVTVSLSGDAGDELFGGYNRYLWAPSLWKKIKWMPFQYRKLLASAITSCSISSWDKIGNAYNFLSNDNNNIPLDTNQIQVCSVFTFF